MDKQYPPVDDIQIVQREQTTHPDGDTTMEEQYSLEEWLGMLEEAGYSLEEGSVEDETSALKAALSAKGSEKTLGKGMADIKAVLQRLQAARKAAKANESYTLEEWMGALEEAGYSLDERNMANKAAKDAFIRSQGQAATAGDAWATDKDKVQAGRQAMGGKGSGRDQFLAKYHGNTGLATSDPLQKKAAMQGIAAGKATQQTGGRTASNAATVDTANRNAQDKARAAAMKASAAPERLAQAKAAGDQRRFDAVTKAAVAQRKSQTPPAAPTTNRPPLPPQTSVGTARPPLPGSKPPVPPATRSGPPPVPPLPPKTATRSGPPPVPPLPPKKPKLPPLPGRAVAEAINENTVSRLQSLAGIKPTE